MKTPTTPKQRQLPSAGVHPARLVWIADLGTQASRNPAYKPTRKVLFAWEITDETAVFDGIEKPFLVSQEMSFKATEGSNLYAFVKGWLGIEPKNMDWSEQLGKPGLVTIVHNQGTNGITYANIANVAGVPKNLPVPEPFNKKLCLSLDKTEFSSEIFEQLPEWIQNKIKLSPEYEIVVPF